MLRPCFMDLCSVLWMRADLLKENELVRRIRPPFIARFHVSAYQFVLPLSYAFRKFYRCKYILMNTRVFRTQVSDPCSFQHREELALSKCYPHCPLAAKILERRAKDKQSIVKPATLPASHPKQLAPTILVKEAPSTKDLVEARLSRFTKKSVSK